MADTRPQWRVVSYVKQATGAQNMENRNARSINEAFDIWAQQTHRANVRVVEVLRVVDTWERTEELHNPNGHPLKTRGHG